MSESVSCGLDGRLVGADKAERGRTKACTESTLTRERKREPGLPSSRNSFDFKPIIAERLDRL